MVAISIVDYIYDLKQAGFTDRQSEVQARKLEQLVAQVIAEVKQETKHEVKQDLQAEGLATKQDIGGLENRIVGLENRITGVESRLELAIEKVRYDALKFTVWTGVAVVVTLGGGLCALAGMFAKGFHWV